MEQRRPHQPPLSIEAQIENLKSIGLHIEDEEEAKNILNNISYFRLIKAYSLRLKEKNGNYYESITFRHILELYLFNAEFCQILFPQIEKIEINTRCRISNFVAEKYGIFGYIECNNFLNEKYHVNFMKDVEEDLYRNEKSPFVKNFQENYVGGNLPVYALVEILSFGTLSKFYKNMKNEDKKIIAKTFGVGYTYFESWLECISYVRNVCAHYGRLYNAKLVKRPIIYKQYSEQGITNNRVFAVMLCLRQLCKEDKKWNSFVNKIEKLIEKCKRVDVTTMGFPENWKELLKW